MTLSPADSARHRFQQCQADLLHQLEAVQQSGGGGGGPVEQAPLLCRCVWLGLSGERWWALFLQARRARGAAGSAQPARPAATLSLFATAAGWAL